MQTRRVCSIIRPIFYLISDESRDQPNHIIESHSITQQRRRRVLEQHHLSNFIKASGATHSPCYQQRASSTTNHLLLLLLLTPAIWGRRKVQASSLTPRFLKTLTSSQSPQLVRIPLQRAAREAGDPPRPHRPLQGGCVHPTAWSGRGGLCSHHELLGAAWVRGCSIGGFHQQGECLSCGRPYALCGRPCVSHLAALCTLPSTNLHPPPINRQLITQP